MSPRAHIPTVHFKCTQSFCAICDGGLTVCRVCGGAEGALTTECAGEMLSNDRLDEVYKGKVDFKGGEWVDGNGQMPFWSNTILIDGASDATC